jgi:hypothetical protein
MLPKTPRRQIASIESSGFSAINSGDLSTTRTQLLGHPIITPVEMFETADAKLAADISPVA